MRVALLCGSLAGSAVFGAAAISSIASLVRTPTAERFLLFEAPSLLLAATAAAGLFLIGRGWRWRQGQGMHCSRCGHPWSPETNRLHTYCQECGAPWRWFGGRVRGRPISRPTSVVVGLVLCSAVLAALALKETAAARLTASSPTWLLIRSVEHAPWHEAELQWHELRSRTLSPADRDLLARAILRKRSRERSIPGELAGWFDSGANAGWFPSSLSDRWFEEMFEVTLSTPSRATVGEAVPVIARAHYLGGWVSVADRPQVVVTGLRVGGEERDRAGGHRRVPAPVFARGGTLVSDTIYPDQPGPLPVSLHVFFFIGSPAADAVLDGQDAPDFGPTVYLRRIVLERTIEIDPAVPAP